MRHEGWRERHRESQGRNGRSIPETIDAVLQLSDLGVTRQRSPLRPDSTGIAFTFIQLQTLAVLSHQRNCLKPLHFVFISLGREPLRLVVVLTNSTKNKCSKRPPESTSASLSFAPYRAWAKFMYLN